MKKVRDYGDIVKVLKRVCKKKYFNLNRIGVLNFNGKGYDLFHIAIVKKKDNPYVLVSSGTHGWEPAGVYTTLKFLEEDVEKYLDYFNFYVFPCNNPSGFEYDTAENLNKLNLNREFKKKNPQKEVMLIKRVLRKGPKSYVVTVDLHEVIPTEIGEGFTVKDNPLEFYLYEDSKSPKERMGDKIINVLKRDIPICKRKTIYGDINNNGVVNYPEGNFNPVYKKGVTFDNFLFKHYTRKAFVFETSAGWKMKKRVRAHRRALNFVISYFSRKNNQLS